MTPDSAAWVRAHAWTPAMRREARDLAWIVTCACQSGPTWHCTNDRHDQCARATALPRWEAVICDRTGIYPVYHAEPHRHPTPSITGPRRERVAQIWLADRTCRWVCPCTCHTGARPAAAPEPETVPRTSRVYEVVELPLFDLLPA